MRVAFVDDSEQAHPARARLGPLLAFAAAIVPETNLSPSTMSGYGLPNQDWPYGTDDGLGNTIPVVDSGD